MPNMDVFNSSAFSMLQLTAALLDRPHLPGRLGQLGIFQSRGIRTTSVDIERKGSTLQLVQTSPRGGPAVQNQKNLRNVLKLDTFRIAVEDTITADEIQNIRSFGSESDLQTLVEEVNERVADMSNSLAVTEEFQRIGAVKGQVLDADGSVLVDLFSEFGVTAQAEVGLNIAATPEGQLRAKINQNIIRPIEDELGGISYESIHVMCSSQFFDDLVEHLEVREALKGFPAGAERLLGRTARRSIDFAGVTWEEYRGQVGSTKYVADDKAHAFPVGVPDLFLTRYAPAEYWDSVNTVGLPRYVRVNPDGTDPDHKRTIRVQTQVLHICTRPRTLIPLRRGV